MLKYWRYNRDEESANQRFRLAIGGFALATTVAICLLVWSMISTNKQIAAIRQILPTDAAPTDLMGWAGQEAFAASLPDLLARTPRFQIIGDTRDNAQRVVHLWDAEKQLTGDFLPTYRQLIGDCVEAGAKQATERLHCIKLLAEGGEYKPIFGPYHYATGRNAPECGKGRIRGPDGSIGGWQALALQLYGVLPTDAVAADGETLPEYSVSVIKQWAVRMPAAKWVELGKLYPIKTIARVTTADQIRDAICSGYPVTIASDWGGLMSPPAVNGKLLNRKATTWQHQMCVLAYDGATPGGPSFFILNSWGPTAHGKPVDDSPPGGFWIKAGDMNYIAKQDCWALSDAEGFPQRDWVIIGGRGVGWRAKPADVAIARLNNEALGAGSHIPAIAP